MSTLSLSPTRRDFLATAAARAHPPAAARRPTAIRPFHVNVPEDTSSISADGSRATRWPDKETVADKSQGAAAGEPPGTRPLLGDGL